MGKEYVCKICGQIVSELYRNHLKTDPVCIGKQESREVVVDLGHYAHYFDKLGAPTTLIPRPWVRAQPPEPKPPELPLKAPLEDLLIQALRERRHITRVFTADILRELVNRGYCVRYVDGSIGVKPSVRQELLGIRPMPLAGTPTIDEALGMFKPRLEESLKTGELNFGRKDRRFLRKAGIIRSDGQGGYHLTTKAVAALGGVADE